METMPEQSKRTGDKDRRIFQVGDSEARETMPEQSKKLCPYSMNNYYGPRECKKDRCMAWAADAEDCRRIMNRA